MIETPAVHTWVFARGDDERYVQMTRVFQHSCHKHGVGCHVHTMPAPEIGNKAHWMSSNHHKLIEWKDMVDHLPDGRMAIISDSDMMLLQPFPTDYFVSVRHVALTRRENHRLPFNAGVVVVRGGEVARNIFAEWVARDTAMYKNPELHKPYRNKYAGMNQASLGLLLEDIGQDKFDFFPCRELNCCQPWPRDLSSTYFVHVKSELRKAVFGAHTRDERVMKLRKIWRELAEEIGIKPVQTADGEPRTLAERYRRKRRRGARYEQLVVL